MHNLRFSHFDVNTFRNPRGAEAAPAVMASPMHGSVLFLILRGMIIILTLISHRFFNNLLMDCHYTKFGE